MKSILFAKNLSELFFQLKNNKELTVVGGCTELDELPEKSISVYGIPDLSRIIPHSPAHPSDLEPMFAVHYRLSIFVVRLLTIL